MDPAGAVRLALSQQEPVGRRIGKLKALKQHAASVAAAAGPRTGARAPSWLVPAVQQLLPLLLDAHEDLRSTAAGVVAALAAQLLSFQPPSRPSPHAAIAAPIPGHSNRHKHNHPAGAAEVSHTLLFDWVAEAVTGRRMQGAVAPYPPPPPPQQLSFQHTVALVSSLTLALAAASPTAPLLPLALACTLAACVALLEAPGTTPDLLPHLLSCISACVAADAAWCGLAVPMPPAAAPSGSTGPSGAPSSSITPVFTDVVDLLLGWSLDPGVPAGDRSRVHDLFAAEFRNAWAPHAAFGVSVAQSLAADMSSMAGGAGSDATGTEIDIEGCLRMEGALCAVLQGIAQHAAWNVLCLLPALTAALSRLVGATAAQLAATEASHQALADAPPSLSAHERRARAAARAAAEATLTRARQLHADVIAAVAATAQRLAPVLRDAVQGSPSSQPWPPPESVLAALQAPCCPAAGADVCRDEVSEDTVVRRMVAGMVQRIVAAADVEHGQARGSPAAPPLPMTTNCSMALHTPGTPPSRASIVVWSAAGLLELVLQALGSSPASLRPPSLPPLLAACATTLRVATHADEDAGLQLSRDPRLLGTAMNVVLGQAPRLPVLPSGIWAIRGVSDPEVQAHVTAFIADVMSMSSSMAQPLADHMSQQLAMLEPSVLLQEGAAAAAAVSVDLATLRLAAASKALTQAQLAALAGALERALQQASDTGDDRARGAQPLGKGADRLLMDAFSALQDVSVRLWFGGLLQTPPVVDMVRSLRLACRLLLSGALPAGGAHASGLREWPAALIRIISTKLAPNAVQHVLMHPAFAAALIEALECLAALPALEARRAALDGVEAAAGAVRCVVTNVAFPAQATLTTSGPQACVDDAASEARVPPLDLTLGLTSVALRLLGDSNAQLASEALPLVLALSAAPVAALSTAGAPAASTQSVDAWTPARVALVPPAWHDALAHKPPRFQWRPASLARLLALLFTAGPSQPGGLASGEALPLDREALASAAEAARLPSPPPSPAPGVLLLRRPADASAPAAASYFEAQAGGAPQQTRAARDSALPQPAAPTWLDLAARLSPIEHTPPDVSTPNADDTSQGQPSSTTVTMRAPSSTAAPPDDSASFAGAVVLGGGTHTPSTVWGVMQDAAKAVVSAQLCTHLGGPGQTLAALERLLAALLAQLVTGDAQAARRTAPITPAATADRVTALAAAATGSPAATLRESARLALEFVGMMERGVLLACHGGWGTPGDVPTQLPRTALAFYSTNRRVCEEWFSRNRDVLLRISLLAGADAAAVFHGTRRLEDLATALSAVAAAAPAQAPTAVRPPDAQLPATKPDAGPGAKAPRQQARTGPALLVRPTVGTPPSASSRPADSTPGSQGSLAQGRPATHALTVPTIGRDVVNALLRTAEALLALGEWGALHGLHAWATQAFASLFSPEPTITGRAAAAVSEQPAAGAADARISSGFGPSTFEDPLLWLLGFSDMAQGRYEPALHHLATFMRQQHARHSAATAARGAAEPSVSASTLMLAPLQPAVAARMAECYAALSDWASFHAFIASHQKRAGADPVLAGWWAPCAASQHMQDICRLASFDANGPFNPEIEASNRPLTASSALLAGLHAVCSAGKDDQAERAKVAEALWQAALPELAEPIRQACWQGWHRGLLPKLLTSHVVDCVASSLRCPPSAATIDSAAAGLPLLSTLLPEQPLGSLDPAARSPDLSLACLILPSIGGSQQHGAWPGFPHVALPTLQHLLRHQTSTDRTGAAPGTQQLLLLAAATARQDGNTDLAARLHDRLAALPCVAASPELSASLAATRIHMGAEVGTLKPLHAAAAQLSVLQPLLLKPRQLLALAEAARGVARRGSLAGGESVAARTPLGDKGMAPGGDNQAFGQPLGWAATHSLAAALLSLSHWAGRCPPAALAALTAQGPAAARAVLPGSPQPQGPTVLVDWVALLKQLSVTPVSAASNASADGAHGGRNVPLHTVHVLPVATKQPAPAVPQMLIRQHALRASVLITALHLAPELPSAWMQWGTALLGWYRQARQHGSTPAPGGPLQLPTAARPAATSAAGSDEAQLATAGVHALCTGLRAAAWRGELSGMDDSAPAALRVLQVVLRLGPLLEERLAASLALPPPTAWLALAPQLLAQLRTAPSAVRRLALGPLLALAAALPAALLYPVMAEARALEGAGAPPHAEIEALAQAVCSSHPRVRQDVATLMVEAQRLTVTWEERWHALLTELEVDVSRRCVTLRAEAERLQRLELPAKPGPPGGAHPPRVKSTAVLQTNVAGPQGEAVSSSAERLSGATTPAPDAAIPMALPQPLQQPGQSKGKHSRAEGGAGAGISGGQHTGPAPRRKKGAPLPLADVARAAAAAAAAPAPSAPAQPPSAWARPLRLPPRAGADPVGGGEAAVQGKPAPSGPAGWGASGMKDVLPDVDTFAKAPPHAIPSPSPPPPLPESKGAMTAAGDGPGTAALAADDGADRAHEAAEAQAARIAMLHGRYKALMSPVVVVLERNLAACRSCPPETPAEQCFAEQVLPALAQAIAQFKAPPASTVAELGSKPQQAWAPVKAVLQELGGRLRNPSLHLPEVSPALAALTGSGLPIPGFVTAAQGGMQPSSGAGHVDGGVTIVGFHPSLLVLASKTRPKRVVLLGSDGLQHVFLLKGRDDLRVDERLMQVMRVSNTILRGDRSAQSLGLAARHYSVTPLGDRVGLIQWVERTTSIFSLFKGWQGAVRERHAAVVAARQEAAAAAALPALGQQQRGAQSGASAGAGSGGTGPGTRPPQHAGAQPPPIPPPNAMVTTTRHADLFYAQLVPELRAAGLAGMVPRQHWPRQVLRRVLGKLMKAAPAHLVSHLLLGASGSFATWWARQRSYAASLGVSSVMGYVLGIGDRHLDNILLDSHSGEVVHIDFNVCFGRGLALRVPELVPFRLTQALAAGLGPAGREAGGGFRSAAEAALRALRAGRDVLVALLDAVLGDPSMAAAWAHGGEREAAARRDLELVATLSLFVSRMDEGADSIAHHCEALRYTLAGPGAGLLAYLQHHMSLAAHKTLGDQAAIRLAEAQAAEADARNRQGPAGEHLQAAVAGHRKLQEEARVLQATGARVIQECEAWEAQHLAVLAAVRGEEGSELTSIGPQTWRAAWAGVPLGLLQALGGQDVDGDGDSGHTAPAAKHQGMLLYVMPAAFTSGAVSQEAVVACMASDQEGAELLDEWDALLGHATAGLGQYAGMLSALLPPAQHQRSHHATWRNALVHALAATSPEAMEQAKALVPKAPNAAACVRIWWALHEHAAQDLAALEAAATDAVASAVCPARPASAPPEQGPSSLGVARQAALELLASFAAVDGDGRGLAPLRGALHAVLLQAADQLRVGSSTPTGPGAVAALLNGSSSPGTACLGVMQALGLLDRVGLCSRLGLGSVEPSGPPSGPTPAQQLLSTLSAAAAAWLCLTAQAALAPHAALADLHALVRQGEAGLLRDAADVLADIDVRVGDLVRQAGGLETDIQLHQYFAIDCPSRAQDIPDELLRLEASMSSAAAQRDAELLSALNDAHRVWTNRLAAQQHLERRLHEIHEALAGCMDRAYNTLLGPAAALGTTLAGLDVRASAAHVAAYKEAIKAEGEALGGAVPGVPTVDVLWVQPAALCAAAAADDPTACRVMLTQRAVEVLAQCLPARDGGEEAWGNVAGHMALAAPTGLLLFAAHTSAALRAHQQTLQRRGGAGSSDGGDGGGAEMGARLPGCIACWLPQVQALAAVRRLVAWCIDEATPAPHLSANVEPPATTSAPPPSKRMLPVAVAHGHDSVRRGFERPGQGSDIRTSALLTEAFTRELVALASPPLVAAASALQDAADALDATDDEDIDAAGGGGLSHPPATDPATSQDQGMAKAWPAPEPLANPSNEVHAVIHDDGGGRFLADAPPVPAALPELQAFTDFDPTLAGAGLLLEEGEHDGADSSCGHALDDLDWALGSQEGELAGSADDYNPEWTGNAESQPAGPPAAPAEVGKPPSTQSLAALLPASLDADADADAPQQLAEASSQASQQHLVDSDALRPTLLQTPPPSRETALRVLQDLVGATPGATGVGGEEAEKPPLPRVERLYAALAALLAEQQGCRQRHLATMAWVCGPTLEQALGEGEEVEGQLVDVLQRFFATVALDPLEPTKRLRVHPRRHLLSYMQDLCDRLPVLAERLDAWVQLSGQVAHAAVAAAGEVQGVDVALAGGFLSSLIARRQQWLDASRAHAARLAALCGGLVAFEASCHGSAWAPGSQLVPDAFAHCRALLAQVEEVYAGLGRQYARVLSAQQACQELAAQQMQAAGVQRAAQAQQAACAAHLSAHLPRLVLCEAGLVPALDALTPLLHHPAAAALADLGAVLRELHAIIAPQQPARDVASLAAAAMSLQAEVCAASAALRGELANLATARLAVAQAHALPIAVIQQCQAGQLPTDAATVEKVSARAAALLAGLQPAVDALRPSMQQLMQMPALLEQLTDALEAVTSSSRSVAAAIQSEHAFVPEGPESEPAGDAEGEEAASEARQQGVEPTAEASSMGPSGPSSTSRSTTPPLQPPPGGSQGVADAAAPGLTPLSGTAARAALRRSASTAAVPSSHGTVSGAARSRHAWRAALSGAHVGTSKAGAAEHDARMERQRKAYIVSALKACILKLEGRARWDVDELVAASERDSADGAGGISQDAAGVLTVAQQVQELVDAATSPDNLCRMYEGWMPWV